MGEADETPAAAAEEELPDGYTREEVTLGDGRVVEVLLAGEGPRGDLVFHHGTPSAAVPDPVFDAAVLGAGLRLIAVSRPGYGLSTAAPGRSVASTIDDVREVLDRLGVDRFVSAGVSGGGPYALGCGALLAGRCAAVADISGVAPFDAEGLDWLAGMGKENVEEFDLALAGGSAFEDLLEAYSAEIRTTTSIDPMLEAMADLFCAADLAAVRGVYAATLVAGSRRAVLRGPAGWRDDDLSMVRPWGFRVEDVAVPVSVWHGTEDRMVPLAHARWIAGRIPAATIEIGEGEGHISIVPLFAERIVAGLLAHLDPGG